jgi:hypothetical protein
MVDVPDVPPGAGKKKTSSTAYRVQKRVDKVMREGGRRLTVMLTPEANEAAKLLVKQGYATSTTHGICRALVDVLPAPADVPNLTCGYALSSAAVAAAQYLAEHGYADTPEAVLDRAVRDAARVRGFT